MTDFMAYITAQQRMRVSMREVAADETRPRASDRRNDRLNLDAVRQRISNTLYRLADAVRPFDEPADAPLSAAQ